MAAVAGVPGLSALLIWPTDHLTEAAAHWEDVGERNYRVAHGVWSDALGVDWDGEAADALRSETHADMLTTSGVVDQLQEAASVARRGASELDAARSSVRYAVEDARSAGFEVGEDLSVIDRMTGGSAAQMAARQAAAEAHATNIGGRAAQLVSVDAQVASRVTAAVAGVGSTFPKTPPTLGQVRAVDNRTFKQGPDKPPPPPPPKGPSAADMRKVLEKLPKGSSDDIREVRTEQDLENLKRWMSQNGVDGDNRYGDPAKGSWTDLPDGSKVGERFAARSTGQNVLDIDLKNPKGNEDWKVHINPKTGGVPEIPAAQPAPAKASPAEVAPAEQAPAEVAPAEEAPVKGFEGGGPAGIPVTPHFVHPPGTIEHGAPIIGEDDPGEDARDFRH
jgi:hypothetical protein